MARVRTATLLLMVAAMCGAPGAHASARATLAVAPKADPFAAAPVLAAQAGERKQRSRPERKRRIRSGLYSGGGFADGVHYVSLRVGGTRRRATETATLGFDCGRLRARLVDTLSIRRTILRGGRSRFDAPFLEDVAVDVPEIGGLRRKGTVSGKLRVNRDGTAYGNVRSRFVLSDPETGRRVARCDSGLVRWQARVGVGELGRVERGRPKPAEGEGYFGITAQKRPIALEMAKRGKAIERIGMAFDVTCPSAGGRPLELAAERVRLARSRVRRGRFSKRGTFTRSVTDPALGPVRESYEWRLTGRFGPATVAGSWRVNATVTSTTTGAEVGSCSTERNRWRALR